MGHGKGRFWGRDSGNNHLKEPRTGISVHENLLRNWYSQFIKKHQANRQQSGPSATLFSYCAGMKIISEAKLPIYQKSSMAYRVARHLRLLCQLKYLTALKPHQQLFSELYPYDALNLLSCMTLDANNIQFIFLHHKDNLLTVLISQ